MVDYKAMQNSSDEKSTIAEHHQDKLMLSEVVSLWKCFLFSVSPLGFLYRFSMFSELTNKSAPK